jgi:glycosyltransferase involved in cell wall biosynthesis
MGRHGGVTERLRIAQVAPTAGPVRAQSGESVEQLVWMLTEELVRRGHDVTLFATGDSETSAALHAVYPRGYDGDPTLWDWRFRETTHVAAAFERAAEFDVIHSHAYHFALPFTRLVRTPVVHSYHVLPSPEVVRAYGRCPQARVVAISDYQRRVMHGVRSVEVVHHGVDTDAFAFGPQAEDYLVFLGRIMPEKAPVAAIQLARRAGLPLVLAGPVQDETYFQQKVRPLIDGCQVRYIGQVGPNERNRLLAGALALVYPVAAPEPFGLVMVEAMACGTPVLALQRGAVPEIIDQGTTGYYAPNLAGLAQCVAPARRLNRGRVRQAAVDRFDYRRMVDGYVRVYRRLVDETARPMP